MIVVGKGDSDDQNSKEKRHNRSQSVSIKKADPPDVTSDSFTVCTHQGWLSKQGGSFKTWKRRYFILYKESLFYFRKPNSKDKALGMVTLTNYSVLPADDELKKKFTIKLVHRTARTYYLVAENMENLTTWMLYLRKATTQATADSKAKIQAEIAASEEEARNMDRSLSTGSLHKGDFSLDDDDDVALSDPSPSSYSSSFLSSSSPVFGDSLGSRSFTPITLVVNKSNRSSSTTDSVKSPTSPTSRLPVGNPSDLRILKEDDMEDVGVDELFLFEPTSSENLGNRKSSSDLQKQPAMRSKTPDAPPVPTASLPAPPTRKEPPTKPVEILPKTPDGSTSRSTTTSPPNDRTQLPEDAPSSLKAIFNGPSASSPKVSRSTTLLTSPKQAEEAFPSLPRTFTAPAVFELDSSSFSDVSEYVNLTSSIEVNQFGSVRSLKKSPSAPIMESGFAMAISNIISASHSQDSIGEDLSASNNVDE